MSLADPRRPAPRADALPPPEPIPAHLQSRPRPWSRTDTERWLNDRHAPLLAYLRQHPLAHYRYTDPRIRAAGSTLREHDRHLFDRAHAALLAAPDENTRESLHLGPILR